MLLIIFSNDTAPTETYTLSLHDALPIYDRAPRDRHRLERRIDPREVVSRAPSGKFPLHALPRDLRDHARLRRLVLPRSEEHTSELQSQSNLVCRLLLEKKNKRNFVYHQK